MTRKEASFILANIDRRVCDDELSEALDMSIKALEQEPIIDKIREEIKGFSKYYLETEKVLEIIDEYRSERI